MKAYTHPKVLAQKLSAFYESERPEYLKIEIDGIKELLVLKGKPGSEFMAGLKGDRFTFWEKSDFARYNQRNVLEKLKGKIRRITFMAREFKRWPDFVKFLEDPDVVEEKYRSTVEFPKSMEVAMRLRADRENKNIKELMIDALKAYL